MENFGKKSRQEGATATAEFEPGKKTETPGSKKESRLELTNRLERNVEKTRFLEAEIERNVGYLDRIRRILGLSSQQEESVSVRVNREKLAALKEEYDEIRRAILADHTYPIDNLRGIFGTRTHIGYRVATKGTWSGKKAVATCRIL